MYAAKKQRYQSPEKAKGVPYFNHFPSNFLSPYGRVLNMPTEAQFDARANPKSCEWLLRPDIAVSEFSATMTQNLQLLMDANIPFLRKKKMEPAFQEIQAYLPSLSNLNSKNEERQEPTSEDVNNLLKFVLNDKEEVNEMMANFFEIGGAMYLTAIHYLLVQHLVSNPRKYSMALTPDNDERRCDNFKAKGDLKSLKDMLLSMCLQKQKHQSTPATATTSSRKRLLDELNELIHEEEEEEPSSHETATTTSQIMLHEESSSPTKKKRRLCGIDQSNKNMEIDDRGKGQSKKARGKLANKMKK